MKLIDEKLKKIKRKYYSESFDADVKEHVIKELNILDDYQINCLNDLEMYIKKSREFGEIISDAYAWKYIKMTCYADNPNYIKDYNDFNSNILSMVQKRSFQLQKKIYDSPYRDRLPKAKYSQVLKVIKSQIELFREENIALSIKDSQLSNKYASITSQLTVDFNGEEKTLVQMRKFQKDPDREVREKAWRLSAQKLISETVKLNNLYDEMLRVRGQMANNAEYNNARDFYHQQKCRFAYTPDDIKQFHDSVEKEVIPYLKQVNEEKKDKLKLRNLRPWDIAVNPDGRTLKPFTSVDDFITKTILVLSKVKPEFGKRLKLMHNTDFLDLDNRKGKAPGGYNISINEYGASFIFMNAIGLHDDIVTLLHESGHAMHSFAMSESDIPNGVPSELAELAAMTMELFALDYMNEYYPDHEEFKMAKIKKLRGTLSILPWMMVIDAFQQWVYTNPQHSVAERMQYFQHLMNRFNAGIDWSGLDNEKGAQWLRVLHIFQFPFYTIEYAISQLGAVAIYKNYKQNKEEALKKYENFLCLGGTKSLNEAYEIAGINFDFSQEYIREIVEFVKAEIEQLK